MDQPVVVQVVDFSGRVVDELELGDQPAGEHLVNWDTRTLEQGVYYLRMKGAQGVYRRVVIAR
jgi:flagellar hook assembly protein FlgD